MRALNPHRYLPPLSRFSTPRHFLFLLPSLNFRAFLNPTKTLTLTLISDSSLFRTATMSMAAPSVQVKDRIDLTEKEAEIFGRLKEVLRYFNLDTQLRVAGGWVRDKLLGKDCYDIDIAIENMLGREFCERINEYLSKTSENGEDVKGKFGVIQSNPDQSKHLETARMHVFDMWIDFVNLRSEDYSENSRIPTMKFGTAKGDAYRRDLTINSLFYNINTDSVEDFTGRGITDLKSGKIVTPLPPKKTFLDDPLRVLRAIRFGARFDFVLDETLKEDAASDEVRAAIRGKISRERVGHEVDLMIAGNQPVKAVTYIFDLRLFWDVFSLPPNIVPPTPEACDRLCVTYMDAAWRLIHRLEDVTLNDEQRRLCLYAALFLPLRSTTYKDNRKKKVPAVDFIFRNSLKLKAKDSETVLNVHRASHKFLTLLPLITSEEDLASAELEWVKILIDVPETGKLRVLAGLLLREIKDFWQVALLVSTLLNPNGIEHELSEKYINLEKSREIFKRVTDVVFNLGLQNVWEVKPLVNGKDIMNVMHLKPGPDVKEWQEKVIEWQLVHPAGTADECLEWMRETSAKHAKTE